VADHTAERERYCPTAVRVDCSRAESSRFKAGIPRLKAFDKAFAANVPVSLADDARAERAWQAYEDVGRKLSMESKWTKTLAKRRAVCGGAKSRPVGKKTILPAASQVSRS
jgi:hypothetical protein